MKAGLCVNCKNMPICSFIVIFRKKTHMALINVIFRPRKKYKKGKKHTSNLESTLKKYWTTDLKENKGRKKQTFTFTGLLWHFKAYKKLFELLSYNRSSNKSFVVQKVFLTPLRTFAVLQSKEKEITIEKPPVKQWTISSGSQSFYIFFCLLQCYLLSFLLKIIFLHGS